MSMLRAAGKKIRGVIDAVVDFAHDAHGIENRNPKGGGREGSGGASDKARPVAPKVGEVEEDAPGKAPPVVMEPGKGLLSSFVPSKETAGKALAGAFALHVANEIAGGNEAPWKSFFSQVSQRGAKGPEPLTKAACAIAKDFDAFAGQCRGEAQPQARSEKPAAASAKAVARKWQGYSREESEADQHTPDERSL